LSGRENLELSAALYDLPGDVAAERIDELLDLMDLAERGATPSDSAAAA
jgi:ABC-type multidrug transport system ATPase subunit